MNKFNEMRNSMQTRTYYENLEERVDLQKGTLVFNHSDFEWDGELMPISIHHVYNSALSDIPYGFNYEKGLFVFGFESMKLGRGWRLNIMQSMMKNRYTVDGVQHVEYIFTDENGISRTFSPSSTEGKYVSIDDNSVIFNEENLTIYDGNKQYSFDSNRLIKIYDSERKCSIDINYTEEKLTSVIDGAGREFVFQYDDNYLKKIIAPDTSYVLFSYDKTNQLLTSITPYKNVKQENGSYTSPTAMPEDHVFFSYDTSSTKKNLTQLAFIGTDSWSCFQRRYSYLNDKVSEIQELRDFGDNTPNGILNHIEAYTYLNDKVSTVSITQSDVDDDNSNGSTSDTITVSTTYVFDEDGNILSKYCTLPDGENAEMSEYIEPANPYSSNGGELIPVRHNLLKNHSLNTSDAWECNITYGAEFNNDCINGEQSNAAYGKKSFVLHSENSVLSEKGYNQTVCLPAGTYTFSAFVKVGSPFNYTGEDSLIPGVYIEAWKTTESGNTQTKVSYGISESVGEYDNSFVRINTTFTLDSTENVSLGILMNGAGRAYVSAPQLEEYECTNEYNFIENGHVENTSYWEDDTTFELNEGFTASGAFKLDGSTDGQRRIRQTVYPKSDKTTRESYVYSAWIKAPNAQPVADSQSSPQTRLRAVINYTEGLPDIFTSNAVPGIATWQKVEVAFEKTRYESVYSIDLYFDYDYQTGTAYVDDLALIRTGIETGLSAEDFPVYAEETETFDTAEEENTSDFREAVDEKGNTLTETLFEDGYFGAFYRSFAYSANKNDKISETDNRGLTTSYTVDSCNSRVTSVTDKCGNIKEWLYNRDGKVSKIIEKDSEGNTLAEVSLEYDLNGNVTKATRGDGAEYNFSYNTLGLLTNSNGVLYTYRSNSGRLKSVEYANGDKCCLTYDRFGKLAGEAWEKGGGVYNEYRYSYDREGNLVKCLDTMKGKEYNYIYQDGRLTRISVNRLVSSGGNIIGKKSLSSIRFTYNKDGSVKKKEYTSTGFKEYFRYPDDRDTVKKYLYKNLLSEFHSSTDRFGRRMTEELRTKNKLFFRKFEYLEGQITPTHEEKGKVASFPETNLVKNIDYSNGRSFAYEYDNEGRIISCNDSTSSPKTYAYDAKGQLKSSTVGDATTLYQYDSYGNIVAMGNALSDTEIADDNDKISCVYSDPNHPDRLTQCRFYNGTVMESFNFEYDAQGNPTQYRAIACEWEKGRQLKRFGNCTYRYNPDGMRTSREIVKDVDGEQVLTELYEYEYEGTKLIRQKRLDLESGDSFEIIPLYDNADSPIGIIYDKISDDTFTPRQYWFLRNLQGDVLSLLDEDGVEVVRYTYNDWGQVTIAHDVSGVLLGHENPFRWRGYQYEKETTLYYLVTRYYDSRTGHFLNEDDHAFLGASGNTVSYNLYTYCENDPVNNVDPMGRMALSATLGGALPSIMAGIGASIAGIKTAIATSWLVPVCIAATAVAMIGIIHVVNKAKVLMISASQAISAVQNMIKEYSNNKLKPHGYTVYVIVREKTTDVVYVGITNNFSRRKSEHTNPGKRFSGKFKMFAIATGLTKLEARIMEQTIITAYTLDTLQNMINSISPKKWSNFNKEFNQLKTLMESWVDPN